MFTLANLTRITISALWPVDGLLSCHMEHLRCLELIAQSCCAGTFCPQTDAMLLPLIKPLDVMVAGREQRQTARAVKWACAARLRGVRDNAVEDGEEEGKREDDDEAFPAIPVGNAANWPSLECLALPYKHYSSDFYKRGEFGGDVSEWTKAQPEAQLRVRGGG